MNRQKWFCKMSGVQKIFATNQMCVRIVVDYEDTQFSNFAHEFVHKNENHFCLVIWGTGQIFKAKKWSKISCTVPLITSKYNGKINLQSGEVHSALC